MHTHFIVIAYGLWMTIKVSDLSYDLGVNTQLAIFMGPMWAPKRAVQPGSIWVLYGLAHVNEIK